MHDGYAKTKYLSPPSSGRIIAVSDIHGNLPFFKALLSKIGFGKGDTLIIDGDFLEKGPYSLATMRFIMDLSRGGNVHTVCGNCDDWARVRDYPPEICARILDYVQNKRRGLLWDMSEELGLDPMGVSDAAAWRDKLFSSFAQEWAFLGSLPDIIDTPHYTFAHAAIDGALPLDRQDANSVIRFDALMKTDRRYDKWLVVGHYPVVLYHENLVDANPIIDRNRKLISIDGGCVLKDDGQLNALIIPFDGSEDFRCEHYDGFKTARVLCDQAESERSYYIRWGDSSVQVLERGAEFCRCRHIRTGYEMDILTKYLFTDGEFTDCNDCSDYVLPLRRGDVVAVVEKTSRGFYVKHGGVSGWYFGQLDFEDEP